MLQNHGMLDCSDIIDMPLTDTVTDPAMVIQMPYACWPRVCAANTIVPRRRAGL